MAQLADTAVLPFAIVPDLYLHNDSYEEESGSYTHPCYDQIVHDILLRKGHGGAIKAEENEFSPAGGVKLPSQLFFFAGAMQRISLRVRLPFVKVNE